MKWCCRCRGQCRKREATQNFCKSRISKSFRVNAATVLSPHIFFGAILGRQERSTDCASFSSRKSYLVSLALTSPWLAAFRGLMMIGVEQDQDPSVVSPLRCGQMQLARIYTVPLNFLSKEYLFPVISLPGRGARPLANGPRKRKTPPCAFSILAEVLTLVEHSEPSTRHQYSAAWWGSSLIYLERRRRWCQWEGIRLGLLQEGVWSLTKEEAIRRWAAWRLHEARAHSN